MLGLRYVANPCTDPKEKAAAYQSLSARYVHAVGSRGLSRQRIRQLVERQR
jgi:hypothetical protein